MYSTSLTMTKLKCTLLLFIAFLFLLTPIFSNAQDNPVVDSLEKVLLTNPKDSTKMAIHDRLRRYFVRVELEKAKYHAQEMINLAKKLDLQNTMHRGQISLGQVLFYKGEYQNAIKSFLAAEPYFAEKNDSIPLGSIYNGLAVCYQDSDDSISLNYYYKAYDIFSDLNPKKAALALTDISNVHADNKEYYKAIELLEKSLKLLDPIKHKYYYNMVMLNLGNSLSETGSYAKAETIYTEILGSYQENKDLDLYAYAIGGLGYCETQQGKYKKGIIHLEEAVELGEKIGFREDLLNKLIDLSNAYQKSSDYKNAFLTLSKHKTLSDTLFSKEKEQILADAIQKFEVEKKDQEIALLNTENELATLKYQKTNRSRIFFIVLSLGLLLIIGLLYKLIQDRKKANQILKKKNDQIRKALNEKEVLLREIHHRVKNNLQVISSLLSIQSRKIDDPSAQEAMQESRNRVRSMALIHQNLYQDEQLVGVGTKEYIEKLSKSLVENYKVGDGQIDIETDIDDVKLDVDTIIPLGLILNELISNALKYAFDNRKKGKIIVKLKKVQSRLNLQVADDGVGIPETLAFQNSDSIGFRLIQAFSTKLGAELKIDSLGDGTKINMSIPNFKAA